MKSCIHSQWKRHLGTFGFGEGEGLFVHMKEALRPDEDSLDLVLCLCRPMGLEKVIPNGQHPISLQRNGWKNLQAIRLTELAVEARYDIESVLPKQITFVHTEELVERYQI